MRIETIRDEAAFRLLAHEWDALLQTSDQDGPFLRHHWLSDWWDVYRGKSVLNVLCCFEGDRLVGAMPLFNTLAGRLPLVRRSRFIGDEHVGSTGLTPFALPEVQSEAFESLLGHLIDHASGWDVLDLRFMDPDGEFFRLLSEGHRAVPRECGACPRIDLPSDWDAFLGKLSKHARHEVRRSQRRMDERGIEIETVRDGSALPQGIEDFLRLHSERMRSKFGAQYEVPEQFATFTTRTMKTLLAEDRLRLMFLGREGRRVAGLYMFRYGNTMYAEQSGFEEEYAQQGVLRVLWSYAIRNSIEEGCSKLDMLLGEQRYKTEWGADDVRRLSALQVYGTTPAGVGRRVRDGLAGWAQVAMAPATQAAGASGAGSSSDDRPAPSAGL